VIAECLGGQPGALLEIESVFSGVDDMVSQCDRCRMELDRWADQARIICSKLRVLSFYALCDSGKDE
jgi:hypothetical protein